MSNTLNINKRAIFILALFLQLSSIACELSKVSGFKKGAVASITKFEIPAGKSRILYYDLEPQYQNCTIKMDYFTLYHFRYKSTGSALRTAIDLIGPKQETILQDVFKLTQYSSKPLRKSFKLKHEGTYKFVIRNLENYPVIGNIMVDFEGCHHEEPDLTSNDMHSAHKNVEGMIWRLYDMFAQNEVSETQMEYQQVEIVKFNQTLSAAAFSEAFAVLLIAGWQIWIIKSMLEQKNIV